jgi:hypothetical protein
MELVMYGSIIILFSLEIRMYLDNSKYILLFLLGEENGSQQLFVILGKEVVEEDILLLFLGELMDLGKQLLVYCKKSSSLHL